MFLTAVILILFGGIFVLIVVIVNLLAIVGAS